MVSKLKLAAVGSIALASAAFAQGSTPQAPPANPNQGEQEQQGMMHGPGLGQMHPQMMQEMTRMMENCNRMMESMRPATPGGSRG